MRLHEHGQLFEPDLRPMELLDLSSCCCSLNLVAAAAASVSKEGYS